MSISSRDKDGSKQRKVNEICATIGFKSDCLSDRLDACIEKLYELLILNKNSTPLSEQPSDKRRTDPDYNQYLLDMAPFDTSKIDKDPQPKELFNCRLLCKKWQDCPYGQSSTLNQILDRHCFESRFPTRCKYQLWTSGKPENDPANPYPKCIAKQKDVPVQLPKDRTIKDYQFCWNCIMIGKKQREQKLSNKVTGGYRGPRVDWGDNEGYDAFDLGDR